MVQLRDFQNHDHFISLLDEGHQFGEIGLIFNRTRTASVMTKNYAIMARLSKENYRFIVSEEPIMKKMLLNQVYQYKDPNIRFLKKALGTLPFIRRSKKYSVYSILFSLQSHSYERGQYIF